MKIWIASASALLMAAACSASKDATAALAAMNLQEGTSSPIVKYQGKSGNGDTITLKNVVIGPGGNGLKADSLVLGGLDMTEGGKPVVTSITLKGVTPEQALPKGMKFNLNTIAIEGLNPVTGEFVASSLTEAGPATPPPFEQWGFSKVSINGMTFVSDGAAEIPGKVNVQLGEFSVSNLKDTLFGGTHLSGFKGDFDIAEQAMGFPVKGAFDFGTADIKNIRGKLFEEAVSAGMAAATDPSAMAGINSRIMEALGSPIDPGYDAFAWSGMNIDASGAKLVISKVDQKVTRNGQGIATAISTPRTTITFTADSAGGMIGQQVMMGLALVGYPSNTIELYGEGDATFDPASDTTRYVKSNFGLTDGIDIKMAGGVQGLTKALGSLLDMADTFQQSVTPPADGSTPPPMPEPDFTALTNLKIVDLDLTLTDKSLVNLVLGIGAMATGGEVEALRTDVVNQIKALASSLPPEAVEPAVATEFTNAIAAFVKQPGSLNIKLKPAQPLAIGEMGSKGPVTKAQLGFSASFTPSPTPPAKPAPKPAQ
jgi:hypothetical protein